MLVYVHRGLAVVENSALVEKSWHARVWAQLDCSCVNSTSVSPH